MKSIFEYITTKTKPSIIKATKETIFDIVRQEIERLGKDADLNHIDVSKVIDFTYWDKGPDEPENLLGLFETTDFCGDISKWNMSKAERIDYLFCNCENFNGNISDWNVENIESCCGLFSGCISFKQDLSKWNMKNITNITKNREMFWHCPLEQDKWPKFNIK